MRRRRDREGTRTSSPLGKKDGPVPGLVLFIPDGSGMDSFNAREGNNVLQRLAS